MTRVAVNLTDKEEEIIKEFKELENLNSKEKAIKFLISKSPNLISELDERIKTKQKYLKKQNGSNTKKE